VKLERLELPDIPENADRRAKPAIMEPQERKVRKANQEPKVKTEKTAAKVKLDLLVETDFTEHLERWDIPDFKDQKEKLEPLGL
jgi:hypothetical protein